MCAESARHERGRDAVAQDGVVGRVEDAVADAGQYGQRQQHRIGRRQAHGTHGAGQQQGAADQHAVGTPAVDQHAGHRLRQAGCGEEQRHQQAELGVGDVQRHLEQRKQRRQHQMRKMAAEMADADQPDGPNIAAGAGCGCRHATSSDALALARHYAGNGPGRPAAALLDRHRRKKRRGSYGEGCRGRVGQDGPPPPSERFGCTRISRSPGRHGCCRSARWPCAWACRARRCIPMAGTSPSSTSTSWRGSPDRPEGKLVLVTAISPTPAGEGKTTTTVGLGDGLNRIGKLAAICLREPSLGPCFGQKGGAAGGGHAQVVPMESINLHFTGDFHAIGSANNLLAAMVDNHVYWGNARDLDVRRIAWRRALDMNDRSLREIVCSLGGAGQRLSARGRLRHHRGVGGHGGVLPQLQPRRARAAPVADDRRLDARQAPGDGGRPECRRGHDRPAQGRADAQSGADAGGQPGLRAWRAVRQHRAWLQLGDRHPDGLAAGRLRGHRSRLRRRPGSREVLRHQVPQGRAGTLGRRRRGHRAGAEDAWRRRQGAAGRRGRRGPAARARQSGPARDEPAEIRRAGGGGAQSFHHRPR